MSIREVFETGGPATRARRPTAIGTIALLTASVDNGRVVGGAGHHGPLPVMMAGLLQIARAGALDGYLLSNGGFYQTDYTRPLLFIGDGTYLSSLAGDQHLLGSQWGMMNETGSYPGQTWLWLYTLWYQIPPCNGNANADLMVVLTMLVLSAALVLVPFIPRHSRHPALGPGAPADVARLLPRPTRLVPSGSGLSALAGFGPGPECLSPCRRR